MQGKSSSQRQKTLVTANKFQYRTNREQDNGHQLRPNRRRQGNVPNVNNNNNMGVKSTSEKMDHRIKMPTADYVKLVPSRMSTVNVKAKIHQPRPQRPVAEEVVAAE